MMNAKMMTALGLGLLLGGPAMAQAADPGPAPAGSQGTTSGPQGMTGGPQGMTHGPRGMMADGGHWHDHEHGHGMMPMLPGVTLSASQKLRMHRIFADDRSRWHDDAAQEQAIDARISTVLLGAGPIDRAALTDLMHQKEALTAGREAAWMDRAVKVHDILTPQQLDQARTTRSRIDALHAQIQALMHDADDRGGPVSGTAPGAAPGATTGSQPN